MAIFGKDPAPPKSTAPRAEVRPDPAGSLLGPRLSFEGTLTGTGNVLVEAEIRGRIDLESDLRVGPGGRVHASVHARNVIVEGLVEGDISADERIELVATATVRGNLSARRLVVAEGARFEGGVGMHKRDSRNRTTNQSEEKTHVGSGQ